MNNKIIVGDWRSTALQGLKRLVWHGTLWSGTWTTLKIIHSRLSQAWDERLRDAVASDAIIRDFESSWEESVMMRRTLIQDLHQKLEGIFGVASLMASLEKEFSGNIEDIRSQKLIIWEELKVEIISRMLTCIYALTLLSLFLTVGMSIVAKSLYRQSLLSGHSHLDNEDLAAANRNFICIAARFVQQGSILLAESIKNAVRAIFSKISLQEPTNATLLGSLIAQVRYEIESTYGRNTLNECLFGKLDDMVSSDMKPGRRRLFIAAVNEARSMIKCDEVRGLLQEHISRSLEQVIADATTDNTVPFVALLPKIGKIFHRQMTTTIGSNLGYWETSLKRLAASVFVEDINSDICETVVKSASTLS